MKLEFLRTLLAVLETGTFATAAKRVNLSPSAVSLQMRQLETYFGQPLFDRSGRLYQPTPFALEVALTMRQTLDALKGLRDRAQTEVSGMVRLAASPAAQVTLLPTAIRLLHERYGALELHLSRGGSPQLIDEVRAGRIDAAVVIQPTEGATRQLQWYPLYEEKFVLLAPPNARRAAPVNLLRKYSWIRHDRETTGGMVAARYVTEIAPGIRCAYDLPSVESVVAMVSAGVGVAVLPMPAPGMLDAYPMKLVALGPTAPTRQVSLVCRQSDADVRRIRAVLEAFQAAAQRHAERTG